MPPSTNIHDASAGSDLKVVLFDWSGTISRGGAFVAGGERAWRTLHRHHVQIGIVSTIDAETIRGRLGQHGAASLFSVIVGDAFDKITALTEALRQIAVPAQAGLYVSDTAGDVAAARQVGLRAVGVRSGFGLPEELTAAGAEAVMDSIADLGAYLWPA